ncbi:MAG: TlpA disulfide reductase family protein [Fidelibacterota bacterium]
MSVRSKFTVGILLILSLLSANFGEEAKIPDLTLKLLDGSQVKLSSFVEEGLVLIDFWATWCAPCKKEMVFLERIYQTYKDQGVTVLAINQDTPKSLSKVKSYIRSRKYSFVVALDPNQQIAQQLNAIVLPTTLLVDQNYHIVWRHQGYIPGDEKEIEKQINQYLQREQKVTN